MSLPIFPKRYTFVTHNTASIQNNPIEYRNVLTLLAHSNEDTKLQSVAQYLLRIDSQYTRKKYLPIVRIGALQDMVKPYLVRYRTILPTIAFEKDLAELVKEEQKNKKDAIALFQKYETYGKLDKLLQDMSIKRPSLTEYNTKMIEYVEKNETIPLAYYANSWFSTIEPHLIDLYEYSCTQSKEDNFAKDILLTFAFDWWVIQRVSKEKNGLQAWSYLTNKLSQSALGKVSKKAMILFRLYKKWNADIICLQEANVAIRQYLLKQGYIMATDTLGNKQKKGSLNSIILYKKSSFLGATITAVHLSPHLKKKYVEKGVSPIHLKRLYTSELTLNLLRDNEKNWLIASFHADTAGHNTLLACQLIYEAKLSCEKKLGKKVELIVGMDSNTKNKQCTQKRKREFQELVSLIKQRYKTLHLLHYTGNDTDTVNKVRTSLQPQLNKAHIASKDISDCIILSTSFGIAGQQQSCHGPNLVDNPSDHKALGVTFFQRSVQ